MARALHVRLARRYDADVEKELDILESIPGSGLQESQKSRLYILSSIAKKKFEYVVGYFKKIKSVSSKIDELYDRVKVLSRYPCRESLAEMSKCLEEAKFIYENVAYREME